MKSIVTALATVTLFLGVSMPSQAQVVTGPYAPSTTPSVPTIAVSPVQTALVLGTIPMRRGLFGWRIENVPVFAGSPVVASPSQVVPAAAYQSARPVVITSPPAANTVTSFSSGAFAYPTLPTTATVPNAVIQSNFRGTTPIYSSGYAPVLVPVYSRPVNTFFPGAVMTMQ